MLKKFMNGALAWDGGQGPWGKLPQGQKKPQNTKDTGGRRPSGPAQPDIEDVMNAVTARLGNYWGGGRSDGGLPFDWRYVAGIVGVIWLLSGTYIIAPDELGVVTRFGRYVQTSQSGLNYHLPWPMERVQKVPVTRENILEVGFRSGRDGLPALDVPAESMMLTGDENIVDLDFTVRWRIANPADFLFNIARPEDTVAAVAESVMRETIGRYPIDDALTANKLRIQQEAKTHLQAVLDYYKSGVSVSGVELQRVNPPDEVIESFRDVQAARADAEKAVNEAQGYANQVVPMARGQAAQVLEQAEGYKTAQVARAEGDASRFTAQVQAYQANRSAVRDRLYFDTMESVLSNASKVVVTGKGGGNLLPFLPLDRVMPRGERTETIAVPPQMQSGGQ